MSRGVDVNSRGVHQVSGLVWASGRGHDDVVRVLLGKKVTKDHADRIARIGNQKFAGLFVYTRPALR